MVGTHGSRPMVGTREGLWMGLGGPQKPIVGAMAGTRVGDAVEVRRASGAAKRLLDVVVSATALLLLSVAIAAIAFAIKLDSRGPVFYRCRRVGSGGRELWMLKFRKMPSVAEGPALTVPDDATPLPRPPRPLWTWRLEPG